MTEERYKFARVDREGNLTHREFSPTMRLSGTRQSRKYPTLENYLEMVEVATLADLIFDGYLNKDEPFWVQEEVNSNPNIQVMQCLPTTALSIPRGMTRFLGTDFFYLKGKTEKLQRLLDDVVMFTGVTDPPAGEYSPDITKAHNKEAGQDVRRQFTDAETLAGLMYGVDTKRIWMLPQFDIGKGPLFAARGGRSLTYAEKELTMLHPDTKFEWNERLATNGEQPRYVLPEKISTELITLRGKNSGQAKGLRLRQYLTRCGPATLTDIMRDREYNPMKLPEMVANENLRFMDMPTENGTSNTLFWAEDAETGEVINGAELIEHARLALDILDSYTYSMSYMEVARRMADRIKENLHEQKAKDAVLNPYGKALVGIYWAEKKLKVELERDKNEGNEGPQYKIKKPEQKKERRYGQ